MNTTHEQRNNSGDFDTTEFLNRMQEKHDSRPPLQLTKRGKLVATVALLATGFVGGIAAYNQLTDPNTKITYTETASTYPNPTDGGKNEIRNLISTASPQEAEAAKHIDASDLAYAISQAVFKATGEDARHIQGIKTVKFTFDSNGNILRTDLVGDSTEQTGG